jgi:hypothetical protein
MDMIMIGRENEENAIKSNEELIATEFLVDAVEQGDYKTALATIKDGANVNEISVFHKVDDDDAVRVEWIATPLQFAVYSLHYRLIKLLLENGADPNIVFEGGESIVEILMMKIGHWICAEYDRKKENYVPKFFQTFGIQKEFSRPIKLRKKNIDTIEKILDVLLCYGLDPNIPRNEEFINAQNNFKEIDVRNIKQARKTLETNAVLFTHLSTSFDISLEENKSNLSSFEKKLYTYLAYGVAKSIIGLGSAYLHYKNRKKIDNHIHNFILTDENITHQMHLSQEEIKAEKNKCWLDYGNFIFRILDVYRIPSVLINLILEYCSIDLNKIISQKRLAEKRTLHFWPSQKMLTPSLTKEEKAFLREREKYKIHLNSIYSSHSTEGERNHMTENAQDLILDYAVGPKGC